MNLAWSPMVCGVQHLEFINGDMNVLCTIEDCGDETNETDAHILHRRQWPPVAARTFTGPNRTIEAKKWCEARELPPQLRNEYPAR